MKTTKKIRGESVEDRNICDFNFPSGLPEKTLREKIREKIISSIFVLSGIALVAYKAVLGEFRWSSIYGLLVMGWIFWLFIRWNKEDG